jgi:hypothetical protein
MSSPTAISRTDEDTICQIRLQRPQLPDSGSVDGVVLLRLHHQVLSLMTFSVTVAPKHDLGHAWLLGMNNFPSAPTT